MRVLQRREQGVDYVENLLETELARTPLGGPDRGLCQELAYGVVRWQATLDWLISQRTQGRTQKPLLQILLRLGLYQMFWLDRIPDHAAVHETVELAKHLGFGPQSGFINAVLRNYGRELDATRRQLKELQQTQPAIGLSHPDWLWQRWQRRWGTARATELLGWNNQSPRNYARLNTLKTDAPKLIEQWRAEGVDYDFFQRDWTGENLVFELKQHPPLERLKSFQDGWFYVQDPSTLLAVQMLAPKPGERLLDTCAAPGGKTTFAALLMQNQGAILAEDTAPDRLKLVQQNCARLGIQNVATATTANLPSQTAAATYDKILIDAPCSNTGVLRRRVDLRWRIRPEEITRLLTTQSSILAQSARRLAPGGTMVYSTCSLEPDENRQVIEAFLAKHPNFTLAEERELIPFTDGVDGAYVARLELKPN